MSGILQNVSALSVGPQAVSDPCVSVYNRQQHIAYRDQGGFIWDSWYDGEGGWHLQQINGIDGKTSGPLAVAGPFICVFHEQVHFAYLDNTGIIWDSWYDGHGNWKVQEINFFSANDVPAFIDRRPGAPLPVVAVWTDGSDSQQHFTYLAIEPFGFTDIFWSSGDSSIWPGIIEIPALWTHQTFQDTGVKPGSSPVLGVFGNQQHVVYIEDSTGTLVDHWYDGDSQWNVQKITGPSGNTSGPPALHGTLPAIWVDHTNTQQHFTYVGVDRVIYDAFWDGDNWHLEKLTSGGKTQGPAAWSSPSVCNYQPTGAANNAVYIAYRDHLGVVWTLAYTNGSWFAFQIKNLPFGAPASPTDLPLAAGNVKVWVDVSGNQLHYTFLSLNQQGPVLARTSPLAIEARDATGARLHHTGGFADGILGDSAGGVIWDFFYEP